MPPQVKICGITTYDALQAVAESGAAYAGFVFHTQSPRYLDYASAQALVAQKPEQLTCVGLFVDPGLDALDTALSQVDLDMIQLHGHESPEHVRNIRVHAKLPVMKALPIADSTDLAHIDAFDTICDWLLFDAKPAPDARNPGGAGQSFDWDLLSDIAPACPWMLAGGLNAGNVANALDRVAPDAVDVSSGVEATRGVKDLDKIRQFVDTVRKSQT